MMVSRPIHDRSKSRKTSTYCVFIIKKINILFPFSPVLLLTLWFTLCGAAEPLHSETGTPAVFRSHQAMGTVFELLLFGQTGAVEVNDLELAADDAFDLLDRLEQELSNWIEHSPVAVLNRNGWPGPVKVDPVVWEVLQQSRGYWEMTGGAFDVTVGPLLDVWGFYRKKEGIPSEEKVKQVLDQVGLSKVVMDETSGTVRFLHPGMRIDFGGIGKGIALDRMAVLLKDRGVRAAKLVGGTSSILVFGTPPKQKNWKVDIFSPYNRAAGETLATVYLRDESLSTSTASERYVEWKNRKYGHIFDPETGFPAETDLVSVTVIAPDAARSDALSTAFFVMGSDGVRRFCGEHPETRCVLISDRNRTGKPVVEYVNITPEKDAEHE